MWVDETRPRNQGALLTSWELKNEKIPHTVIVDNAGGHLMQNGKVDLCLVGSDRTAMNGDVCNKIGTYLKAISAYENSIPFYVALPTSTIDRNLKNGSDIPIEIRDGKELSDLIFEKSKKLSTGRIYKNKTKTFNPAFDVTPSKFITALITENGICKADFSSIQRKFENLVMRIIKETIIKNYNLLLQKGMNLGSEGNISVKFKEKVFITPSGVDIKNLKIENISIVDFEGNLNNRVKPSSELDLHLLIYKKRKEINSIVHCHSDWASILSCMRQKIKKFHYMIAEFGGDDIKCSKYATFEQQS